MKPFTPDRPLPIPDHVLVRQVTAATAENIAVPSTAKWARLTSLTAFYLKPDGTAAVPSADVTDGSGSILVPANTPYQCNVEGVTNLSVDATAGTIFIHAEFWGDK